MRLPDRRARPRLRATRWVATALALAVFGVAPAMANDEAARDTFVCLLNGERVVIRFEPDEARMLLPAGERVTLYQIPAASGVRYSNGVLELRGKGNELYLLRDGNLIPLTDCQPYAAPR